MLKSELVFWVSFAAWGLSCFSLGFAVASKLL